MNFGSAKALPQCFVEAMSESDRKALGLKTDSEKFEANDKKSEAKIQKEVEAYLRLNGYMPRTPDEIAHGKPRRGWFVHLHEAKCNPILLDILILRNDGQYFELELKTTTGKIRDCQKQLIDQGAVMARGTLEAMNAIKAWEESCAYTK